MNDEAEGLRRSGDVDGSSQRGGGNGGVDASSQRKGGGGSGAPRKKPSWLRRILFGVAVGAAVVTVACTGAGIYVWYTVTPVVKVVRLVYSVVKSVKYALY